MTAGALAALSLAVAAACCCGKHYTGAGSAAPAGSATASSRPSRDECLRVRDHNCALLAEYATQHSGSNNAIAIRQTCLTSTESAHNVDACVVQATQANVRCWLAAATPDAYTACVR